MIETPVYRRLFSFFCTTFHCATSTTKQEQNFFPIDNTFGRTWRKCWNQEFIVFCSRFISQVSRFLNGDINVGAWKNYDWFRTHYSQANDWETAGCTKVIDSFHQISKLCFDHNYFELCFDHCSGKESTIYKKLYLVSKLNFANYLWANLKLDFVNYPCPRTCFCSFHEVPTNEVPTEK